MPKKTPPRKLKLAELLLDRCLVDSRSEAEAQILAGNVIVNDQRVDKAGALISPDASIRLRDQSKDVSRGAVKLRGAIEDFHIEARFHDALILDVGLSTGGFSQVALEKGAKRVDGVDVGTNVVDFRLRNDSRMRIFEKTHIEKFASEDLYDIIVVDVSFISLARLANTLKKFLEPKDGLLVALVKPQFELEAEEVGDGGIVRNEELQQEAVARVRRAFETQQLQITSVTPSKLKGRSGNQEYFILCRVKN